MKKIYLSLLAFGVVGSSIAQMTAKPYAFGEVFTGISEVNSHAITNNSEAKALGVTIWSDDFDNPGDWTIDNDGQGGGAFGWTIDAVYDGWSTVGGPISSTSGGNYAELSNGNAVQGDQALDVTYTLTLANPIDIINLAANTSNTDQVNLEYEQTGALFNDEQLTQISIDGGGTWITIRDNRDFHTVLSQTGGSAYPNPEMISINLAPYIAGNATNFSLRFQWTTAYPTQATNPNVWITYGWTLDDLKLITNPDNDIAAQMPYWGSVGLHYFQIPTAQVAPIDFSTIAANNGITTQNEVTLNVDVNGGAWTGASAAAVSIAVSATDSLFTTTQYTPAATLGTHTVTWGVTQTEVDDVPANNLLTGMSFDVTEFIYARDMGASDGTTYNQGEGYEVGNLFDVFTDATLYGIDVMPDNASETGSQMYGKLYSIDATTGDFILEEQTDYYEINSGNMGQIVTMDLLSAFTLTAGETYLVVACSDGDGGASDDFVVSNSGFSEPQTTFFYDGTDFTWYYTTSTPIVRMNFDSTIGLEENEMISNVTIHPNPVQNDVNVTYSLLNNSDVVVTIVDLTGKVISTQKLTSQSIGGHTLNINTASFASGLYTLSIESSDAIVSRKFVKK